MRACNNHDRILSVPRFTRRMQASRLEPVGIAGESGDDAERLFRCSHRISGMSSRAGMQPETLSSSSRERVANPCEKQGIGTMSVVKKFISGGRNHRCHNRGTSRRDPMVQIFKINVPLAYTNHPVRSPTKTRSPKAPWPEKDRILLQEHARVNKCFLSCSPERDSRATNNDHILLL